MTDRERLVEVMARAAYEAHPVRTGKDEYLPWEDLEAEAQDLALSVQRQALAAAERAGFEFRKKEEEL